MRHTWSFILLFVSLLSFLVLFSIESTPTTLQSYAGWPLKNITVLVPLVIRPNSSEENIFIWNRPEEIQSKSFGWISSRLRMIDLDSPSTGSNTVSIPSSQVYCHHVVVIANRPSIMGELSTLYGATDKASVVTAYGSDYTATELSYPYAYVAKPHDFWFGGYHVINKQNKTVRAAFELTLEIVMLDDPKHHPTDLLPVEAIWLDVAKSVNFDVPGNNSVNPLPYVKSRTFVSSFNGVLTFGVTHVHSGAIKTQLSLNNKVICDAQPVYESDGETLKEGGAGVCRNMNITVKKGDVVKVVSMYKNNKPRKKVMGIYVVSAHVF